MHGKSARKGAQGNPGTCIGCIFSRSIGWTESGPRLPAGSRWGYKMPLYAERPPLPSDDKRWRIVNGTMRKHGYSRNALIETLHTVQSSFGFLDEPSIKFVAQSLRVPLSQAYGVVTFYHFFSLKPPGRHTCTVCTGTACYIKGSDKLLAETEKLLHIKAGQTTPDGEVSFTTARCVGACGRAPVVLLDGELSGQMEGPQLVQQLERWTQQ